MLIQDYVQQARRDPSTEHIEALWRAVFLLKGWYFLPADPGRGPNRPLVALIDDQPWVVAFTNVRRVRQFSVASGRAAAADDEMHLLVLDPGESMRRILEVADRVAGVVFNPDSDEAFRAPVEALEAYARHFGVPLGDG